MANPDHVERLKDGVSKWNSWRESNRDVSPDLSGANLTRAKLGLDFRRHDWIRSRADLAEADLSNADLSNADLRAATFRRSNLREADLTGANLFLADLREANLSGAKLFGAKLREADLTDADLGKAQLFQADLSSAKLRGANLTQADLVAADLSGAYLCGANLSRANLGGVDFMGAKLLHADLTGANLAFAKLLMASLNEANLSGAKLSNANFTGADLDGANLSGADLNAAILIRTILTKANLTGCVVYGLSAWDLDLEGTIQSNLVITPPSAPKITVDNLEVAQFIYLLLNNKNVRHVIDTITSKVVLILGRFTPERKHVLDAIREELRKRDYLPILFDFEGPSNRDITETVSTLAHMARFVIADITDAKSIPQELMSIVPNLPSVPVQPLLLASQEEYGMFEHIRRFPWVLEPYLYEDQDGLLDVLTEKVIDPAEKKAKEQTGR
jgi:uncharacterized protein YjbI with pentapeptide repeats